jgi:hypothetical protein
MKKILVVTAILFASLFFTGRSASAISGINITVTAVVQPSTYLVINEERQIAKIFNNYHQEGVLYAVKDSIEGQIIEITAEINSQYQALKPSLDFSTQGVIYQYNKFKSQSQQNIVKSLLPQIKYYSLLSGGIDTGGINI